MKYSRFLCIVLCLILLVSISPIQAHAAATGIVIGGMTVTELILNGALGVTAILGALGLAKDINDQTGAWDNLVSSVTGFLTEAGIIQDDNMTIQQTENGQLFIGSDVIQSVKDWLFDSNSVSVPLVDSSFVFGSYTYSFSQPVHILKAVALVSGQNAFSVGIFALSSSSFSYSRNGVNYGSANSRNGYSYLILSNTTVSSTDYSPYINDGYVLFPPITRSVLEITDSYVVGLDDRSLIVPDGIAISSSPPAVDTDISVNYIDWYKLALQANGYDPDNPPADKLPYWPVSFSRDQDEIDTLSQEELWTGMNSALADIESGIGEGNVTLGDIKLLIKDFFTNFPQFLEQLWEDIRNLPQTLTEYVVDPIVQALKELFVPDVADITAAIDAMKLKFPFFDSIIGTWKSFQLRLSGSPPVIYAHLQNAEGNYSWGGTVAVLDMSFYERYKSLGDAVLSAALWCFFGWRMFVKLPGLISGAAGDIQVLERSDKH